MEPVICFHNLKSNKYLSKKDANNKEFNVIITFQDIGDARYYLIINCPSQPVCYFGSTSYWGSFVIRG